MPAHGRSGTLATATPLFAQRDWLGPGLSVSALVGAVYILGQWADIHSHALRIQPVVLSWLAGVVVSASFGCDE